MSHGDCSVEYLVIENNIMGYKFVYQVFVLSWRYNTSISISIISNNISLVLYFRGFVHPYCLESSNKI